MQKLRVPVHLPSGVATSVWQQATTSVWLVATSVWLVAGQQAFGSWQQAFGWWQQGRLVTWSLKTCCPTSLSPRCPTCFHVARQVFLQCLTTCKYYRALTFENWSHHLEVRALYGLADERRVADTSRDERRVRHEPRDRSQTTENRPFPNVSPLPHIQQKVTLENTFENECAKNLYVRHPSGTNPRGQPPSGGKSLNTRILLRMSAPGGDGPRRRK